ncbi:MAG: BlaI/MecI/CopY family transcriptional regulator [Propionibacteriaceae bacterium]|nr:BlaI/MecI/CopY family transcriptional regulator [Propionibacteriaceae bacterium]
MSSRGELEQRVMELLWASAEPMSVADVHAKLSEERELAYTTVMTVLDRLAKKDLVDRELVQRAWQYTPCSTQAEVIARDMLNLIDGVAEDVKIASLRLVVAELSDEVRAAVERPAELV